jgi:hypothetical protein
MVFAWPLPTVCPVIPTFNQDGRQAKNRKKRNEVFKTFSPLKLLLIEQMVSDKKIFMGISHRVLC